MGQDYSYTQPSSSDEYDLTALLEAEAELYGDEAESRYHIAQPEMVYPPQPECDDGIPTLCYCGGDAVVATSYTSKDPGRRYFTCDNVDDGGCHIWKWWDVGVTEELRETQRQVRQLKDQGSECEQKLVKLQNARLELSKKKPNVVTNAFALGGCLLVSLVVFGVLQARFAIVKNPALSWDKEKLGKIMRTCIILHNMIVENERDTYTLYDTSAFEEEGVTRSSRVDMSYSAYMPPNLEQIHGIRINLRDRRNHEQLKNDLIENIWNKFGDQE